MKARKSILSLALAICLLFTLLVFAPDQHRKVAAQSVTWSTNSERTTTAATGSYYYLPPVTNLKAKAKGINSVVLSWSPVSGADGYIIYRKIGKTGAKYRTTSKNTTLYDGSASCVDFNFYWVHPYKVINGIPIEFPSAKYVYAKALLPAVQNLRVINGGFGRTVLTWNPLPGADAYAIYRKIGSTGRFQRVAINQGNKLSKFIDTTAKKGVYNFYRVYPLQRIGANFVTGSSNRYVYIKPY